MNRLLQEYPGREPSRHHPKDSGVLNAETTDTDTGRHFTMDLRGARCNDVPLPRVFWSSLRSRRLWGKHTR